MRFSTRTTYGLRAMICLAKNCGSECLSLPNIAKKEGISLGYLERLFSRLKNAGLIEAQKGAGGGYKLSKPVGKIAVYDIVRALEGSARSFYCLAEDGRSRCAKKGGCGALIVLEKTQQAVNRTLKKLKLKDLI